MTFSTATANITSLQWRHNEPDGVSNHQPHDVYSTVYSRRRSKKISQPRVTGLCEGNSPVTGEFPAQRPRNAENVSIWWRHHIRFQLIQIAWINVAVSKYVIFVSTLYLRDLMKWYLESTLKKSWCFHLRDWNSVGLLHCHSHAGKMRWKVLFLCYFISLTIDIRRSHDIVSINNTNIFPSISHVISHSILYPCILCHRISGYHMDWYYFRVTINKCIMFGNTIVSLWRHNQKYWTLGC